MTQEVKKVIYVCLAVFLGWLLSIIAHSWIEICYIVSRLHRGIIPVAYHFGGWYCYLHPGLQIAIALAGIVGGYFLGQTWWRIVYVENRFGWIKGAKKKKKK